MSFGKDFDPEKIKAELENFAKQKFGGQVHVMTNPLEAETVGQDDEATIIEENFSFQHSPRDIKSHLDRYVVGQDEAKKALAIAVCDHYNFVQRALNKDIALEDQANYSKQNVLILGPTGVGKTYMVRRIAELLGVPFAKGDATRFSETGYMGANVEDLIKDLVNQADGDIEQAQFGIVYLDEADKLAGSGQQRSKDVNGRGVQLALLKMLESTEIDLKASYDPASQLQSFMEMQQKGKVESQKISTKHILFIVSGAFTGLEKIVASRLRRVKIGFDRDPQIPQQTSELLNKASTSDFITYGFEPEFIGRLPIRVACTQLSEDSLYQILRSSEGSITKQYENAFLAYGIEAKFNDDALRLVAKKAVNEGTGARSLMTILEKKLRDYKFELPDTNCKTLDITEEMIESPEKNLQRLQATLLSKKTGECLEPFQKRFSDFCGFPVKFTPSAAYYLEALSNEGNISLHEVCQQRLLGLEHGLKLVFQQGDNPKTFFIDEDFLENPQDSLDRLVRSSFKQPANLSPQ